jgi:hypothetical protein
MNKPLNLLQLIELRLTQLDMEYDEAYAVIPDAEWIKEINARREELRYLRTVARQNDML